MTNEEQPGSSQLISVLVILVGTVSSGISIPSTVADSGFYGQVPIFPRANGISRHFPRSCQNSRQSNGFRYGITTRRDKGSP